MALAFDPNVKLRTAGEIRRRPSYFANLRRQVLFRRKMRHDLAIARRIEFDGRFNHGWPFPSVLASTNDETFYTNPKRKRGNGLTPSLALRVGVASDRGLFNLTGATFSCTLSRAQFIDLPGLACLRRVEPFAGNGSPIR